MSPFGKREGVHYSIYAFYRFSRFLRKQNQTNQCTMIRLIGEENVCCASWENNVTFVREISAFNLLNYYYYHKIYLTTGDTLLHYLRSIRFFFGVNRVIDGPMCDKRQLWNSFAYRVSYPIIYFYVVELERNLRWPNGSNIEIICKNSRFWDSELWVIYCFKPAAVWLEGATGHEHEIQIHPFHQIHENKIPFQCVNSSFLMDYGAIIPIRNAQRRANLDGVRYRQSSTG